MEVYPIYSGGKFIETTQILDVRSSFDNSVIARTYLADKSVLESAIAAAQGVTRSMQALPSYKRYSILMDIATKITAKKQYLAEILAKEACKPIRYALGEIDRAVQTFIVAAEESKRIPAEYISIDWTPAGEGKEGLVKHFPVGIVSGIAPFNFPLNLAVHKIAPAIASGNCIILKPARSTPLSTLELARIVDTTELPKGALSVLPMDREAGNQLVTDDRFGLLSFTGSPEVGWKMKQNAGKKKVVLELGGNAGVIVSSSADIDTAVKKCLVGGFAYQGQVCIHVQRILVQDSIFTTFSEKFIDAVKGIRSGSPLDPEADFTAMIDEENAVRVEEWVQDAVDEGAKVLTGGVRRGNIYEPTLLTNTKPKMNVCSREVFGPVVTLERYESFSEAVDYINNSKYGLQAGVFTNSIDEMNQAFNQLHVGGVIINDVPTFRVDHMPYGGIKDSGLGREGVRYAILDMMEPRLLVKNSGC